MTDTRKLLEDAALAAGLAVDPNTKTAARWTVRASSGDLLDWNPLTDDGDAMRLAVKLRISIIHEQEYMGGPVLETVEAIGPMRPDGSRHCEAVSINAPGDDPMLNVRLAIVRAAAQIGAAMGEKTP